MQTRRKARRSPYGKKGGTSVNAGRHMTRYRVELPDGRVVTKGSYQIDAPLALLAVYRVTADGPHYMGRLRPWDDEGPRFLNHPPTSPVYDEQLVAAHRIED